MHQDVRISSDWRGEVGVQWDVERVVMVVVRLVQPSAEVTSQLHGLGAEACHGRQLVHVPRGLDPVDALRERSRSQS